MRGQSLLSMIAIVCVSGAARGADPPRDPTLLVDRALSPCFDTADVDLCVRFAADVEDAEQRRTEALERKDCEDRLVASGAEGAFRCASDRAADPIDAAAAAELGERLARAVERRQRREADLLFAQIVAATRQVGARECTAACNAEGRTRVRVSRGGVSLVRAYEVCMTKSESAPRGRRLHAYDRALYAAYMKAAADHCRQANDCEDVEKYGIGICPYRPSPPTRADPRSPAPY